MKKFNQVIKQSTQHLIFETKEVGEPFICKYGEKVQKIEFVIPKGPLAGKIESSYKGCKCEDIRKVKEIMRKGKSN
jgi:hypothetical protein